MGWSFGRKLLALNHGSTARRHALVLGLTTDGAGVASLVGTSIAKFVALIYLRLACCTCRAVSCVWIQCTFAEEFTLPDAGGV